MCFGSFFFRTLAVNSVSFLFCFARDVVRTVYQEHCKGCLSGTLSGQSTRDVGRAVHQGH